MLLNDYVWFWLHHFLTPQHFLHLSKKLLPANVINLHMEEKQSLISFKEFKGKYPFFASE